uniref:Putative secreted protein salivary gland overexpressed n=1 Tax=Rhipicephalus microplus TaxID=6941 RepID=A0A6M2DDK7_RHIMP
MICVCLCKSISQVISLSICCVSPPSVLKLECCCVTFACSRLKLQIYEIVAVRFGCSLIFSHLLRFHFNLLISYAHSLFLARITVNQYFI